MEITKQCAGGDARPCLVLSLAGERYALDIGLVQEIVAWGRLVARPALPEPLIGVVGRRPGAALPVIDAARRLGVGKTRLTRRAAIVAIGATLGGERIEFGMVVDALPEVLELPAGSPSGTEAGQGAALPALDPGRLVDADSLPFLRQAAAGDEGLAAVAA